ncbi:MAG: hypothetical protein RR931_02690 [Mucinivorans sp.]
MNIAIDTEQTIINRTYLFLTSRGNQTRIESDMNTILTNNDDVQIAANANARDGKM